MLSVSGFRTIHVAWDTLGMPCQLARRRIGWVHVRSRVGWVLGQAEKGVKPAPLFQSIKASGNAPVCPWPSRRRLDHICTETAPVLCALPDTLLGQLWCSVPLHLVAFFLHGALHSFVRLHAPMMPKKLRRWIGSCLRVPAGSTRPGIGRGRSDGSKRRRGDSRCVCMPCL
jgi:hypothetical protein